MPSLTTLTQALLDALDDRETVTLSGGSTTTAISAAWINSATGVTSGRYEGRWLYNQTKDAQSKVSSYDKTTGTQTVMTAMTANANTDIATLSNLFPCIHALGSDTDARTIANRALGRMMLKVESEQAITTADTYAMTSFPSLDRPERVVEVREPSPVAGRAPIFSKWRGWTLVQDPPAASLRTLTPFATTSGSPNLTLERIVPASCWIAVPTTFAESAVGLVNQTDLAYPSVEEWLPFALEEALVVLIARTPGRPNAEWERMLAAAREKIATSIYRDLTQAVAQAPARAEAA